jgi:hypothetical protein
LSHQDQRVFVTRTPPKVANTYPNHLGHWVSERALAYAIEIVGQARCDWTLAALLGKGERAGEIGKQLDAFSVVVKVATTK